MVLPPARNRRGRARPGAGLKLFEVALLLRRRSVRAACGRWPLGSAAPCTPWRTRRTPPGAQGGALSLGELMAIWSRSERLCTGVCTQSQVWGSRPSSRSRAAAASQRAAVTAAAAEQPSHASSARGPASSARGELTGEIRFVLGKFGCLCRSRLGRSGPGVPGRD